MEAIYLQNSAAADFKKHGKANANNYSISSYSSSCHGQNNIYNGHVLYASPFPHHQYYSSSPPVNRGGVGQQQQKKQNQPPLLPLPKPYQNSRSRKLNTCTNNLHQSLSVKKFSTSSSSVREKSKHQSMQVFSSNLIAINRLGPDPTDVPRVLFSSRSDVVNNISKDNYDLVTKFSGSIVSTVRSPPPSSLPLPTFSLRPKGCCNTEAAVVAGVEAGATNNLRRILRL